MAFPEIHIQLPGPMLCFQQEESQETFQLSCLPLQWIYSLTNTTNKLLFTVTKLTNPIEERFLEQLGLV